MRGKQGGGAQLDEALRGFNREWDGREEAVEWSEASGLRMCKGGRWAWWARSQSAVHLLMLELYCASHTAAWELRRQSMCRAQHPPR